MSADADHWWRNRREASANSGDAWSGAGGAYRRWTGSEPAHGDRPAPARADQAADTVSAERGAPPTPASPGAGQAAEPRPDPRAPSGAWRKAARTAEPAGPPNPRAARRTRAAGHRRRGRPLALVAAGAIAVAFLAPLAWAGRWHPCAAAEVALVDDAVGRGSRFEGSKRRVVNWAGPDGTLTSRGRVGRQIAYEEHPGWPPFAGCTALFWRVRAEGASLDGFTAALTRALAVRR